MQREKKDLKLIVIKPNQSIEIKSKEGFIFLQKDKLYLTSIPNIKSHFHYFTNFKLGFFPYNISQKKFNYSNFLLNPKPILIMSHTYAYGDSLLFTSFIKYMKTYHNDTPIYISFSDNVYDIIELFPRNLIDKYYPSYIEFDKIKKKDFYIVDFSNIEIIEKKQEMNWFDNFFEYLGFNLDNIDIIYKRPYLRKIKKSEIETFKRKYKLLFNKKDKDKKIIYVCHKANAFARSINPIVLDNKIIKKLKIFNKNKIEVVFCSYSDKVMYRDIKTNEVIGEKKLLENVLGWKYLKLDNLKELACLLHIVDKVISVDTLPVHLCGAYDIPFIGIYGPFKSDCRIKYYKQYQIVIPNEKKVKEICKNYPCFHHGNFCPLNVKEKNPFSYARCLDFVEFKEN